MASLGPGHAVVVVVPVGGSKASAIKLVLHRGIVNPVIVKYDFMPARFCLTKRMSTRAFANCLRNLAYL
jgi:hypothetical protein